MWCRCSRCLTTESSKESKGENHKARKRVRGGQPLWLRIYEFLPRDLPICSFCVLYQSNDVDIRSITFNRPPLQILPATLNAAVAICSQRGLLLQLSFGETVFFPYLDFLPLFALCAKRAALCFFQSTFLAYGCSSVGYLCPACSAGGCAAGDPAASTRSELHSQLRSRLHSDSCAQRGANDGSPQR